MENIVFGFRQSRFFNHPNAASLFVVYSHDPDISDGLGDAESATVREIIDFLDKIRSHTRSDRGPVLHTRDNGNFAPLHDVLENQSCLLPRGCFPTDSRRPVDKVILCYSQRLSNYCKNAAAVSYMSRFKDAYRDACRNQRKMEGDVQEGLLAHVQDAMRNLIVSHCQNPWFHHVLTEIAFLDLRTVQDRNPFTIVPVVLNDTEFDSYVKNFIPSTQVYLARKGDSVTEMHHLLFKILRRVYEELPGPVEELERFYSTGMEYLKKNDNITKVEFDLYVRKEVARELDRCLNAGPIDVKKPLYQVLQFERGDQERFPAVYRVTIPPSFIDPGMFSRPSSQQNGKYSLLKIISSSKKSESLVYISWLSSGEDQDVIRKDIPIKHAGTLDWVKEHPAYVGWIKRESSIHDTENKMETCILGIRGKAGSGKSILLNSLINDMKSQPSQTHLVLYFFFRYREETSSRSRQGMYRALLHQLLRFMPDAGWELWAWIEGNKPADPDIFIESLGPRPEDTLREWFIRVLSEASKKCRIRIFLDALDEAGDEEARNIVADIRRIDRQVRKVSTGLSICFSCRFFPAIVVDNGLDIHIDICNRHDIFQYVLTELEEDHGTVQWFDRNKRKTLAGNIRDQAEGMFIHAVVQTNDIKSSGTKARAIQQVRDLLSVSMPPINHRYMKMIQCIPTELIPSAKALLRWIAFSYRPLSVPELRYALAVENFPIDNIAKIKQWPVFLESDEALFEHIQNCVGPFIQVIRDHEEEEPQAVFQFMHATVSTFFRQEDGLWFASSDGNDMNFVEHGADLDLDPFSPRKRRSIHHRLAEVCADVLCREYQSYVSSNDPNSLPDAKMLDYAVRFGHLHTEDSLPVKDQDAGISEFMKMFKHRLNSSDLLRTVAHNPRPGARSPMTAMEWYGRVRKNCSIQDWFS